MLENFFKFVYVTIFCSLSALIGYSVPLVLYSIMEFSVQNLTDNLWLIVFVLGCTYIVVFSFARLAHKLYLACFNVKTLVYKPSRRQ